MELFSVLVTGANRGIGLEFVRQFSLSKQPPTHIFATFRNRDTIQDLEKLRRSAPPEVQVHIVKLDVRDRNDLDNLRKVVESSVEEKGLTLLVNNAGVAEEGAFPDVTAENLDFHFQVNTVGPVLVTQTFLPLLKKAASCHAKPGMSFSKSAILNISSMSGSIAYAGVDFTDDLGYPSYKISKLGKAAYLSEFDKGQIVMARRLCQSISKTARCLRSAVVETSYFLGSKNLTRSQAALNMAMRTLAATLKEDNVLVLNICPGWVKTDMTSEEAELCPEESITAILSTLSTLDECHHGTFVDRFGNPHLW